MASAEPFADPPSPSCSSQDESTPLIRPSSPSHPPKPWFHVIIFATLIILLTDLGSLVGQAPLARLYESILCAQYWKQHDPSRLLPDGSVPEELCKLNSMQDTVAVLFGWQWVWDAVPGIALAIPYGNASDRWGRKPVLWLCLIGFVLNLAWMLFVCTCLRIRCFRECQRTDLCIQAINSFPYTRSGFRPRSSQWEEGQLLAPR